MKSSKLPTRPGSGAATKGSELPSVSPVVPLLLLETMRDSDRPEELLDDEDITTSLPRRLGLSEVVRMQIQRFQEEVRQKRSQISSQVEDLIRLVIRRPDADVIFLEAGRRVARRFWSERAALMRRLVRYLPRALALIAAQRAGRRMLAMLVGPTTFKLQRRPLQLTIKDTLTARADPSAAACSFYTGAFEELLTLYTGRGYRVSHPDCSAKRAGTTCVWTVELTN